MANFFKEIFAGERSIWTGARNEKYYERQQQQNAPKPAAKASEKAAEPSVAAAEQAAAEDLRKKQRAIKRNRTVYTSPLGLPNAAASDLTLKTLLGQ